MEDSELDHELEAILQRFYDREEGSRERLAETRAAIAAFEAAYDRAKAEVILPTLRALARRVGFALDTRLDAEGQHDPHDQTECTGVALYVAPWDPRRDALDEHRTRERPFDFDYLAFEPNVHERRVAVRWNTLRAAGSPLRDAEEIGLHAPDEITPERVQQLFNRFVDRVLNAT